MNKEEYFFNTYLGRELNVCGDLIYKGFEALENNQQNILNNDYLYQELGIKDSVDFLQEAPAFIKEKAPTKVSAKITTWVTI